MTTWQPGIRWMSSSAWRRASPRPHPEEQDSTTLPIIHIVPDITAVVDAAQAAIARVPDAPRLFQRARQLCLFRGVSPPQMAGARAGCCGHYLVAAASLVSWPPRPPMAEIDKRLVIGKTSCPLRGPLRPSGAGFLSFPPLESVVTAPTLRPDGGLLDVPGYDQDHGLYLVSNGIAYPEVRPRPALDYARSAIGTLHMVFADFLWAASHYFSAALAAVFSLPAAMGNGAISHSSGALDGTRLRQEPGRRHLSRATAALPRLRPK